MKFLAALTIIAIGTAALPGETGEFQTVRYEQQCREYKQRGVFGLGGTRVPTSDGRVLKQCRQCKITVRRFFPDKKECEPWPALPNQ